jgi:hypothetical protein
MFALGDCGAMKLLSAITAATLKATVVKKPKTFCSRTSAECMILECVGLQFQLELYANVHFQSLQSCVGEA